MMEQPKRARRRTPEQGRGEVGQAQMVAFFRALGWPCDEIQSDYGEDLLVRVFEDGIATGLSFLAQVKSTDDFSRYRTKNKKGKTDNVHYDVAVADLRHWEHSVPSVFLFLWNTQEQNGFWLPLPETLAKLNKEKPGWRRSKTVRLNFTADFSCEKQGLELLRIHLLQHNSQMVSQILTEHMELSFPTTPEGETDLQRFREHLDTGEVVTLNGEYLQTSESAKRLYGSINKWETTLTAHPIPDPEALAMRFEIRSQDGHIAMLPLVQMHRIEKGKLQVTYANGHPKTPYSPEIKATPFFTKLVCPMEDEEAGLKLSISTHNSIPSVQEAREAFPFLRAFLRGGEFRWGLLNRPQLEDKWQPFAQNPQYNTPVDLRKWAGTVHDPEFEGWLEALCFISERFKVRLLLPNWELSSRDRAVVAEITAACLSHRAYQTLPTFKMGIHPLSSREAEDEARTIVARYRSLFAKGRKQLSLPSETRQRTLPLLNASIPLGACTINATGTIAVSPDELEKLFELAQKGKRAEIPFQDVRLTRTYHDLKT